MAYSGFRINIYVDVNPSSASYQQTRSERVQDTVGCPVEQPDWRLVSRYCETSGGTNTGYLILVEQDVNPSSPSYGQQRTTRELNTTYCPSQSTDPLWEELDDSYCEQGWYEPAHVQGNTGYKLVHYRDSNRYSPTWGTEKWERESSSACTAPSTAPQIEEISSSCVMIECSGRTTTNGEKNVYGIDKNVYSPTYLSAITVVVEDETTCPNGCFAPKTFTVYSDVEGANVTWSNGSAGIITRGTNSITLDTTATQLQCTLSKHGVMFENNGATCNAFDSVTIRNAASWVDLGLSAKWYSRDLVGTYKWGAIEECPSGTAWTTGETIPPTSEHDAAVANQGNDARMPTLNELLELDSATIETYEVPMASEDGILFVSTNGNSIWMSDGDYWSTKGYNSGADAGNAEFYQVNQGITWNGNDLKSMCKKIRPVKDY